MNVKAIFGSIRNLLSMGRGKRLKLPTFDMGELRIDICDRKALYELFDSEDPFIIKLKAQKKKYEEEQLRKKNGPSETSA